MVSVYSVSGFLAPRQKQHGRLAWQMTRQNSMAEWFGRRKMLAPWQQKRQEPGKRIYPFKSHPWQLNYTPPLNMGNNFLSKS